MFFVFLFGDGKKNRKMLRQCKETDQLNTAVSEIDDDVSRLPLSMVMTKTPVTFMSLMCIFSRSEPIYIYRLTAKS